MTVGVLFRLSLAGMLGVMTSPGEARAVAMSRILRIPAIGVQTDSICGRVVLPAGIGTPETRARAVLGVSATVGGAAPVRARVDSAGSFVVRAPAFTFPLVLTADGVVGDARLRVEQRVAARPTACTVVLQLTTTAATLQAVAVRAQRAQPRRTDGSATDLAGSEAAVQFGLLTPEQQGDPVGGAAFIPGLLLDPSGQGLAALQLPGADGATSVATVNGIAGSGGYLPRDVAAVRRIAISPFDPARGGFAGAFVSTALSKAGMRRNGSFRSAFAPAALGGVAAAAKRVGASAQSTRLSAAYRGPVLGNRLLLNGALELMESHRTVPFLAQADLRDATLLGLDAGWLQSSQSFVGSLPGAAAFSAPPTETRALYGAARVDLGGTRTHQLALHSTGTLGSEEGIGRIVTQSGTRATTQRRGDVTAVLEHVYTNSAHAVLVENRIAAVHQAGRIRGADPFALLLQRVDASSDAARIDPGIVFGGSTVGSSQQAQTGLEARSDVAWIPRGSNHTLALQAGLRQDRANVHTLALATGSAVFTDTGAVRRGAPAVVERRESASASEAQSRIAHIAMSDVWRLREGLTVQYGVRMHRDAPVRLIAFTDNTLPAPTLDVSPRASLRFAAQKRRTGLLRNLVIAGGVGKFRDAWFASLTRQLGGNGDVLTRECLAPTPTGSSWTGAVSMEALFNETCPLLQASAAQPGAQAAAISSTARFAADAAPLSSWRTQWRVSTAPSSRFGLNLEVAGTYSTGVLRIRDGNRRLTPAFLAANGRPFYSAAEEIDQRSGFIPLTASRALKSRGLEQVLETDLDAWSTRITPGARYQLGNTYLLGQYSLGRAAREYDFAPTNAAFAKAGRVSQWGASSGDVRHQFVASASSFVRSNLAVMNSFWLRSGLPYVPIVRGDLNGDGVSNNDLPFVDATLARGVLQGVSTSTVGARGDRRRALDCLAAVTGRFAAPDACRSGWSGEHSISVAIGLGRVPPPANAAKGTPATPRGFIMFSITGLDRAFGRGLWSPAGSVDPTLGSVTGFDATNRTFLITPNRAFGSPAGLQQRANAPRLNIDLQWSYGR